MLSGAKNNEDAAVFALNDELALVQTLDFITPVVDDPRIFGNIAAANSLSDVFAMGAQVLNALNIVCFDNCNFDNEILSEILAGANEKVRECGGAIIGGHSISSAELYFGLSVTGLVKKGEFWANNTARDGDILLLTKPLGMGVLSTAIKADMLEMSEILEAARYMSELNFYAIDALKGLKVHACTDITGFGLLGHLCEMLNNEICFEIYNSLVPVLSSARAMADMGIIPGGTHRNKNFVNEFLANAGVKSTQNADILLFDAQTSGGLLLAIDEKDANTALNNLKNARYEQTSIIGAVKKRIKSENLIEILP